MHQIKTYNQISAKGLNKFTSDRFSVSDQGDKPDAIVLRSTVLSDDMIPSTVRVIGRAGAGTNNIPVAECTERGIVVMNAPGANANAVKELVISGMLLASRHICPAWAYAQSLTGDDEAAWHKAVEGQKKQFKGIELAGRTLGIIGLGHIGVQLANAAIDLGMRVVGYDPGMTVQNAWMLSADVVQADSIVTLAREADFLSIHVPLNKHTQNLISTEVLDVLPDGATILNFSRAGIVNNEAIASALAAEKLRAYVTDFPHPGFKENPRVIALPHLGASTKEAEENCAVMVADQVSDFLMQGNIKHSVNFPQVSLSRTDEAITRLCIVNENKPNMVAQISQVLAQANSNIVDMVNASRNNIAYSIIDISNEASEAMLQALFAIDGVVSIRTI